MGRPRSPLPPRGRVDRYRHRMVLDALAVRLGSALVASTAIGWGDAGATFRVDWLMGASGRAADPLARCSAIARHRARGDGPPGGRRPPGAQARGHGGGRCRVAHQRVGRWGDRRRLAGYPGSRPSTRPIDGPARAPSFAWSMPTDLGLDDGHATSQGLAERARGWLRRCRDGAASPGPGSPSTTRSQWLAAADRWSPGVRAWRLRARQRDRRARWWDPGAPGRRTRGARFAGGRHGVVELGRPTPPRRGVVGRMGHIPRSVRDRSAAPTTMPTAR